jgi:hypothetical protein
MSSFQNPFLCAVHTARRSESKGGVPQPLPITVSLDKTETRVDEQKNEYTCYAITVKGCCFLHVVYRR